MAFDVTGKLYKKFETVKVSDRFQKRDFVLEIEDGAYPQFIKFQMTQDRCAALDPVNENDVVKVSFNLKGREYTNPKGEVMYFTNLDAWRIEAPAAGNNQQQVAPASGLDETAFPSSTDEPMNEITDDLPF